ncbi:MAG: hypothetical protein GEU98_23880 [Pseudonocardiaceae bacterium]|nr:hypothetical protein [Pseudonocardiaceae bacterium]
MSYPHPEQIYGELASGDAKRIRLAAESLNKAAENLGEAATAASSGGKAVAGWKGDAAAAFTERTTQTSTSINTARDAVNGARQAIENAANAYGSMRGSADKIIGFYRSLGWMLGGSANPHFEQQISKALVDLRTAYNDTLAAQAKSLRAAKPAFQHTVGGTESWRRTQPQAVPQPPAPGTDPKKVADWWKSLSERQRDQLLATQADKLGQLKGLPADVLDTANRRRIETDQQTLAMRAADLDSQAQARAKELGINPRDENAMRESKDPRLSSLLNQKALAQRKADNADSAQKNLRDNAERKADAIGAETYVLSYTPEGPGRKEGGLAVAFGNPDTARDVAVAVPGTGTRIDSDFTGQAVNLKGQMDAANPGGQNAAIAWLGYDAPDWDWSVADDKGAKEGGQQLVEDVNGYRAAADAAGTPRQHVTAIGHSYGSATVGYAGMNGLAADDIALIGSPGAGASSADQLSAGSGHVWAGGNEHDPVIQGTNGSYFTEGGAPTGPYDPKFGAHQFGTDGGQDVADAHTSYYSGESLKNLGNIATGNYGAVTQQDPGEAPIAPTAHTGDPMLDGLNKVAYEGGQMFENGLKQDWGEMANDGLDAVATTVGTVTDGIGEGVKNIAGGVTGLLW